MRTTKCTRSWRRACGKLRRGGKSALRRGGVVCSRGQEGVAPHQTDQGEVTLQPRPRPPLIVPQPQLLFAILMEPLDGPAPVGQAHLRLQIQLREPPGKVPLGLALFSRQWAFADEPPTRPGHVIVAAL